MRVAIITVMPPRLLTKSLSRWRVWRIGAEVTQGNDMGPTLHLIFLTDMDITTNIIIKFIDDTKDNSVVMNGNNLGVGGLPREADNLVVTSRMKIWCPDAIYGEANKVRKNTRNSKKQGDCQQHWQAIGDAIGDQSTI